MIILMKKTKQKKKQGRKQYRTQSNSQPDIDKKYLYAKDPFEAKYQLSFNNGVISGLKYLNDSKSLLNTQMICKIFIKY